MNYKHLYELIDACQPGQDDVEQSELSELARELSQNPSLQLLFTRSQKLDETIRTTFQQVTPPPGLAERILVAIDKPTMEDGKVSPAAAHTDSRGNVARHASRRSVGMWTGVATLVAVAAVITLWFQWPQPIDLSSSERAVAEIAERWNAALDETKWQTTANAPSQEFPTWEHLKMSDGDRWQWVSKHRIVCYDFVVSGGTVRLFVIKPTTSIPFPNAPPVGYPSPHAWHVGAWQANGRVYYLAVHEDGDSKDLYSRVIASPFSPA